MVSRLDQSSTSLYEFAMSKLNQSKQDNQEKITTKLRYSHIGEMSRDEISELIIITEGYSFAKASVKSLQSVELNLWGAQAKVQELMMGVDGLISFQTEVEKFDEPTLRAKADAFLTKLQSLINTPSPTGGFLFGGTDKPIKYDLTTFSNLDQDGKPRFDLSAGLSGTIDLAGQKYSMSSLKESRNQIITAVNNVKGVYTKEDGTQNDIPDATGHKVSLEDRKAGAEVAFKEAFDKLNNEAASLVETRQAIEKSIDPMKKELQQWQDKGRDKVQFNNTEESELMMESYRIDFKMEQILQLMAQDAKNVKLLFNKYSAAAT